MDIFRYLRLLYLGALLCTALVSAASFAGTARATFGVQIVIRGTCNIDTGRVRASCTYREPYRVETSNAQDTAAPRAASLGPGAVDNVSVYTIVF